MNGPSELLGDLLSCKINSCLLALLKCPLWRQWLEEGETPVPLREQPWSGLWTLQQLAGQPMSSSWVPIWAPGHPALGKVISTTLESSAGQLTAWLPARSGTWLSMKTWLQEESTIHTLHEVRTIIFKNSQSRGLKCHGNEWDQRSGIGKMCLQRRTNNSATRLTLKFC